MCTWTSEEDVILVSTIQGLRVGNKLPCWDKVAEAFQDSRDGKSCRLRWENQLRPEINHGALTAEEWKVFREMHSKIGNKWSTIAEELTKLGKQRVEQLILLGIKPTPPETIHRYVRTDNLVKNFFHNGKLTGEKPAKGKKRRADEEDVGRESDSYNLAKVKKMKTQRREIHSCGLARGKRQTKKQELVLDSDSHAQGKKRKAKKSELFAGAVNDDFAQGYTAAMLTAALAYTAQPPMSRNLVKRQRLSIIAPRPLHQLSPATPLPTVPENSKSGFTKAADYQQTVPAEAAPVDWIQLAWDKCVNEPTPAWDSAEPQMLDKDFTLGMKPKIPDFVERASLEDELLASSAPDYENRDYARQKEDHQAHKQDWSATISPAGEGADVMPLHGSNYWEDACLAMDDPFPIVA